MRIRVGNTDAEGRMAMVDVLAHMKEKALNEVNPHLFTIATLTGKYGQSCSGLQRIFSRVAQLLMQSRLGSLAARIMYRWSGANDEFQL